ncbi:hypothetical protein HPB48_000729 [Haemaphysalis longicornis]|uniref:Lipase domain-containing protein n=1 Tax=Haemaphysalis longicornis TaxID=44386 RepID=A0A9J6GZJ2_HAELO|nr:hypothetical protein HPB48_000729 [Haemaphysalis longicornis]
MAAAAVIRGVGAAAILWQLASAGITDQATKLLRRTLGATPVVSSKCMRGLGCFENDDVFYHVIHRPINVLPDDRERIATRFLLYTKRNSNEPEELSADDPLGTSHDSFFNASLKTKVIVHGFMDSLGVGKWMGTMKDEFLKHGDYNVVVVDWSHGNGPPYTKATANTRVVGAELALLVTTLQNSTGASPADFHIIGHSLGAQIAGYAGERLDKIGRITGLDPAGPYFFHMPPSVRLDPSDASFVDVIHSDASLPFSFIANLGFFNDKAFCSNGMLESMRRLAACDHQRSVDFFTSTINRRLCLPNAEASSEDYANEPWRSADNGAIKLYLKQIPNHRSLLPHSMKPGVKYTSLLTTKKRLYDVHNVTFNWKSLVGRRADSASLGAVPRILYFKIRPLDLHVLSKRARRMEAWKFCGSDRKGAMLVPGELLLAPEEDCGEDDEEEEL